MVISAPRDASTRMLVSAHGAEGSLGSKTKPQRFIHRFEQRGIAPHVIERITSPIGLPAITGKEPEVMAVGVVAQQS